MWRQAAADGGCACEGGATLRVRISGLEHQMVTQAHLLVLAALCHSNHHN